VGLKSLKSLNLTNGYPNKYKKNNNNKNNNKVKSKPLELFELAGKKILSASGQYPIRVHCSIVTVYKIQ
jgi:hypothetical protein